MSASRAEVIARLPGLGKVHLQWDLQDWNFRNKPDRLQTRNCTRLKATGANSSGERYRGNCKDTYAHTELIQTPYTVT